MNRILEREKIGYCTECGKNVDIEIKEEVKEMTCMDLKIKYLSLYCVCKNCGCNYVYNDLVNAYDDYLAFQQYARIKHSKLPNNFNIEYRDGNIFNTCCDTIMIPLNYLDVANEEFLSEFKKKFPKIFKDCTDKYKNEKIKIGILYQFQDEKMKILKSFTKSKLRSNLQLEYIESELIYLKYNYKNIGISSIAIPKFDCSYCGVAWEDIRKLVVEILGEIPDLWIEIFG